MQKSEQNKAAIEQKAEYSITELTWQDIRDLTEEKADLPFKNKIGRSVYQPLNI